MDASDRRANALWLTEAGEELAAKIEVDLKRIRSQVFAHIPAQDLEGALRVLDALARRGFGGRAAEPGTEPRPDVMGSTRPSARD